MVVVASDLIALQRKGGVRPFYLQGAFSSSFFFYFYFFI